MTIKPILVTSIIFLFFSISAFSQDEEWVVCYSYDDAGNRTTQSLGTKSLSHTPPKKDDENLTDDEKDLKVSHTEWKAYPNPTFGIINYDIPLDSEERLSISLFDMSGKQLHFEQTKSNGIGQIDVSELSSGDYILSIESKEHEHAWSILKR